MEENLVVLAASEAALHREKVQLQMRRNGIEGIIINDNANLFYLTGRVYAGYAYIPVEGEAVWFIRRPVELAGNNVEYIRRPEDIPTRLEALGVPAPTTVAIELDIASYNLAKRLAALFPEANVVDGTAIMRAVRAVKTPYEQEQMRISGLKHQAVYREVPKFYHIGMTDNELQIEIERVARLAGCLGQFRISGQSMELFMGNILCGDNADVPTPYDFAMGGRGLDPSLPVGASGEEIKPNTTVMVDLNGDFTGYMTDMTRVFSVGKLPELAHKAHQCSIDMCRLFEREARPGVEAKELYQKIAAMAAERGLDTYFMGHRPHASFIGHGLGIEINEMPVIAPRSKQVLEAGNMIALEPKFVIPGTGAVGIENTYLITDEGAVSLTNAPEEILPLD
jgi:Xaa-Pro aminopeptidase